MKSGTIFSPLRARTLPGNILQFNPGVQAFFRPPSAVLAPELGPDQTELLWESLKKELPSGVPLTIAVLMTEELGGLPINPWTLTVISYERGERWNFFTPGQSGFVGRPPGAPLKFLTEVAHFVLVGPDDGTADVGMSLSDLGRSLVLRATREPKGAALGYRKVAEIRALNAFDLGRPRQFSLFRRS